MTWIKSILDFIMKIFTQPTFKKLYFGMAGPEIESLQTKLKKLGYYAASIDGDFGPKTKQAVMDVQKDGGFLTIDGVVTKEVMAYIDSRLDQSIKTPVISSGHKENPAYQEAKKYEGKTEFDKDFIAMMVKKAKKIGLPYFTTIIGTSFAWCALFIAVMATDVGQKAVISGLARDNAKFGVGIEWKENGIPRGAVVRLNHNFDCSSGSNNHVTFADADCAPQDLIEMVQDSNGVWKPSTSPIKLKPGATFPGFGGNQGNMVKRSSYSVKEICEVRWPSEVEKPGLITKSINCQPESTGKESTR